ncbi:DNA repair and recombination protein rad54b [Desmophyllum pertusum]|uniref:DNA repair and recombination protein rad54b n=1 Tax=Desmophyllum pertusum TaxID=174260 RepID=A0A9W9YZ83_9CNID|nr:DNA repair and recombination protein rad54b [Desmophyllum pertusum]
MRRSAAPSVRAAKKMKFCTPFLAESKEGTTGNSMSGAAISLVQQSDQNQVTNHEIGLDVSQTDQAAKSSSSIENDHKVTKINTDPTNCEQEVKPKDKFKPTNLRGPSYPRVAGKLAPFKSPLQRSSAENVPLAMSDEKENICHYFNVVWGKMSKKKHKKWEGDGILITKGRTASLKDLEGKEIAKSTGYKSSELESLQEGSTLCIGGKEIEVMGCVNAEDYLSGKCFQQSVVSPSPVKLPVSRLPSKQTAAFNPGHKCGTEKKHFLSPRTF